MCGCIQSFLQGIEDIEDDVQMLLMEKKVGCVLSGRREKIVRVDVFLLVILRILKCFIYFDVF